MTSNIRNFSSLAIQGDEPVLIITSSHTGNSLMCTPAIRLLKKTCPQLRITVVALTRLSAEVFENNPDISEIKIVNTSNKLRKLALSHSLAICLNEKSSYLLDNVNIPAVAIPAFSADKHHADQILEFMAGILQCEIDETDRQYWIGNKSAPVEGNAGSDQRSSR